MDLRRPRPLDWLVGAAGAALLVSLFLDWYRAGAGATSSGWQAMAINDWIVAVAAALAVGALAATVTQPTPPVPVAVTALAALAGAIAVVLVGVRVAWPPADAGGSPERLWGAWLALAAAAGQLAAAIAANRDERPRAAPAERKARPVAVRRRAAPAASDTAAEGS